MANITKSFNFRNGVQVDDDNLLVNPSGLVGIGTTIPVQALDVRGNASVSGMLSSTEAIFDTVNVTDLTIGSNTFGTDNIIGAGVSIRSGIISALSSAGVVTYYGDGGKLDHIPTSQWKDIDVGLGYTSIYNVGTVGVNTEDPRFSLQVGGNNDINNFIDGVGIGSDGAIVATGIITAKTNLDGNLLGNVQGGIGTITQVLSTNASVTGIITAGKLVGDVYGNVESGISTITQLKSTNAHVTGVVTATTFVGDVSGDVTGDVTGNVTGNIVGLAGTITNELVVSGGISGVATVTTTRLVASNSTIGLSTASTFNITEKLGVGIPAPANNVDIYSTGDTTASIIGKDKSVLLVGQRVLTGIGESVAAIRFGATGKTLEIINGDTGGFNQILHGGGFSGINTGSFRWIHGAANTTLMTLDYKGNLGINKSNPETALDVVGMATFADPVRIDNNLTVNGTIFGNGSGLSNVGLDPIVTGTNLYNTTGVSTFLNVQATDIDVYKTIGITSVAIGTARENHLSGIDIDAQRSTAILLRVGIGSTQPGTTLDVKGGEFGSLPGNVSTETLVVGKTLASAAVDFSNAGKDLTGVSAGRYFMLPPKITTTDRNAISAGNLQAGAIIYNTSTDKLQVYNGLQWVNLH